MRESSYKKIYELILNMSMDAEEFGLFDKIRKGDIEKAKWIKCIADCLNDVPLRRAKHILEHKEIDFDEIKFLEEKGCL